MDKVILITGLSGSGKSIALRMLEDSGFICIDNLPVGMLKEFIDRAILENIDNIGIVVDARYPGELAELPEIVKNIKLNVTSIITIFLESSTNTIEKRYSESRRRHPLTNRLKGQNKSSSLPDCIMLERNLLSSLRDQEHIIDTSNLTPTELRMYIKDIIKSSNHSLILTFESFSYKEGAPSDSDLVFDARCLPNPYYKSPLRNLTGKDRPVIDWLNNCEKAMDFIKDIKQYLYRWLPEYTKDTRNYLTVAVGCTGGQHRSVYVVEQLAKKFANCDYCVLIRHRALNTTE